MNIWSSSKKIGGDLGQFGAFPLLQFDVGGDRLLAEPAHDEIEAVRGRVDVRVVDLVGVAREHDLGAVPDAGDDRLGFERREILRLVDDHELVGDAAPADVGERLHDDRPGAHEVPAAPAFVPHVEVAEQLERVVDRLHPRVELFLEGSGEEPDLLADADRGTRDHEPAELPIHDGALESGGHGKQGFAGAGLAHERDQLDAVVEQRVEREVLLAVALLDAPDAFAGVEDGDQLGAGRVHLGERGALGHALLAEGAILVRVVRAAAQFEFAVGPEVQHLPGVHRPFEHARVEVGELDPVGLVILRRQTEGVGFDPQVDILGDDDGGYLREGIADGQRAG